MLNLFLALMQKKAYQLVSFIQYIITNTPMPTFWDAYDGDVYVDFESLSAKLSSYFNKDKYFFKIHIPLYLLVYLLVI